MIQNRDAIQSLFTDWTTCSVLIQSQYITFGWWDQKRCRMSFRRVEEHASDQICQWNWGNLLVSTRVYELEAFLHRSFHYGLLSNSAGPLLLDLYEAMHRSNAGRTAETLVRGIQSKHTQSSKRTEQGRLPVWLKELLGESLSVHCLYWSMDEHSRHLVRVL